MRKTRVLLLTQWFDPEPTFKGLLFARELVKRGFDVEVLTGFPNYPGGKVYPGYRIRPIQREKIDGISITRVALYPSHSKSGIGRVMNYITFATSAAIYGIFIAKRPDVVYAYHPPLTTGYAAAAIRSARRCPVLYDIQDLWPDTLRATGMVRNKQILKLISIACDWLYKRTDRIAVLSPGFKRLLEERGVPDGKIEVIYNWADETALDADFGDASTTFPATSKKFTVLFAGNMGRAQALDAVVAAARILEAKGISARIVFMGGGLEAKRLAAMAADQNCTLFLPPVPMSAVGAYLKSADALIVHLRDDPLFSITVPSKTQAYFAVGKPVIMAVAGDAADLVKAAKAGVVSKPECPDSIARAIEELAAMPAAELEAIGSNARNYYKANLSVAVGVQRFCDLLSELAARGPEQPSQANSGNHSPEETQ